MVVYVGSRLTEALPGWSFMLAHVCPECLKACSRLTEALPGLPFMLDHAHAQQAFLPRLPRCALAELMVAAIFGSDCGTLRSIVLQGAVATATSYGGTRVWCHRNDVGPNGPQGRGSSKESKWGSS